MPYKIVYRPSGNKKPWKIINKDTGEQVGSSTTKKKAERSVNARLAGAHGAKLDKKKS